MLLAYTTEEEAIILKLIQIRRRQLREEKTDLKKAGELSDRQDERIQIELEELHQLELRNRGHRIL